MLAPARRDKAGGPWPAHLIRTLPFASLQIGAQVASLRCPILRWSSPSLPTPQTHTRGPPHYSPFARTLSHFASYKTSHFADTAVSFCSHRDTTICASNARNYGDLQLLLAHNVATAELPGWGGGLSHVRPGQTPGPQPQAFQGPEKEDVRTAGDKRFPRLTAPTGNRY